MSEASGKAPETVPETESVPETTESGHVDPTPTAEQQPEQSAPESSMAAAATTTTTTTAAADPAPPANILPASHWVQAQHTDDDDEGQEDFDSAYGDDNASSTASLSASILEYRTVHGRTFHCERGNAQSWNPNDAQHDESMDILHHVSTLLQDGKLFLAPIDDKVQTVLDVGCGTGIWAIDFADEHPGAEVTGVDISPQQPQWIPPNLKFEVDDVTQPWTYSPNSFDYIHMRWLVGSIQDWNALFQEVYKAVKPGGYFESKESSAVITSDDGTVADGSAIAQWGKVFTQAGKQSGRSFTVVEDNVQRQAMEAAGFVDIKEYNFKTPIGSWPADDRNKEIGQYMQLAMEQDIEGFVVYMWTTVMGWSKQEIQVYAAHLRRELRSKKHHPYYPQRTLVGRKPFAGETS